MGCKEQHEAETSQNHWACVKLRPTKTTGLLKRQDGMEFIVSGSRQTEGKKFICRQQRETGFFTGFERRQETLVRKFLIIMCRQNSPDALCLSE